MNIDIEKLSLSELDSLLAAAERRKKMLSSRRPPAVVRRKLAAFAVSHGYSINELIGCDVASEAPKGRQRRQKRPKVAVKYRDPQNRRNTWTGRGSMPRWLADKTRRGQSAADFLIPGLGQPTAKKGSAIGRKFVVKQTQGPSRHAG